MANYIQTLKAKVEELTDQLAEKDTYIDQLEAEALQKVEPDDRELLSLRAENAQLRRRVQAAEAKTPGKWVR